MIISLWLNLILLYFIIHDTVYYNKVIKDLQDKHFKSLRNNGVEELYNLPKGTIIFKSEELMKENK